MRRLLIGALLALAACSGGGAAAVDAAIDGAVDAPAIDAPAIDAPALDAALDAPALDASALDAPALDAPATDAALDAPAIDAALDAPALDAPVDAADFSWLEGWPMPQPPQLVATTLGILHCTAMGQSELAWGMVETGPTMSGTIIYRNGVSVYLQVAPHLLGCSEAFTSTGSLLYLLTNAAGRVYDQAIGFVTLDGPRLVIATDPAGGSLIHTQDYMSRYQLIHLTGALTVDATFGTGGALLLGGAVGASASQLDVDGAPIVTVQVGATLRRLALRTGAAITTFGGTGTIPTPTVPGTLIGLATLPDLGLALISRAATDTIAITRIDATGTAAAPQLVAVGGAIQSTVIDAQGRIVVGLVTAGPGVRLARFLATTGALDPTFGTAGHATATLTYVCPANTTFIDGTWSLMGGLGDGRVAIGGSMLCASIPPSFYDNRRLAVSLFDGG